MDISDQSAETRRIVEQLYRCGNNGDLAGALALVAPDIVLHEPAFLPYGGTYRGIEGFTKAFATVVERYVDLPKLEVRRMTAEGDRAFAVIHAPALTGGEVVFAEEFVVRDGKIVEITLYFHDLASLAVKEGL